MAQQKKKFDRETMVNIAKGAAIAGGGAIGLYILGALQAIDFGSILTPVIAALIPIGINAIKEWLRGENIEIPQV